MPKITYIAHDGTTTEVDAVVGSTVMQTAVDNAIEGIVAECGGACSCATCHCYIEGEMQEIVGGPNPIEQEVLQFAIDPQDNSRLGCQIDITEEMDGLIVRLPESQY